MKLKLTKTESVALLPHIIKVLETGKKWEDESLHHPAGAIIKAVLTIPGMKKKESEEGNGQGFTTNGWAYDWRQAFTHEGKEYSLTGSGYHGGHSFHLAD